MTTISTLPTNATNANRFRGHFLLDRPAESQGPGTRSAASVSKSLGTAGIMTSEEVLTAMASYHDRKRGGGGRSDDEKFLRSRLCVRVGDGENKFALVSGMRRVAVVVQVGSLLQSARRLKI